MRKTILAAIIAASTVTAPVSAGGLQSEMDRLFNEMSNTTLPGVHESQRRGVFTGGAIPLSHASMSRTLFPLLHHPGRRDVVGLICLAGRSHLLTLSS